MCGSESDVLNRRFPILSSILFETQDENKKQAKNDLDEHTVQRSKEYYTDSKQIFKYYIHDDPWAEQTEVIVTKAKAKRKTKKLFQLSAQTEVVYLENDKQKFSVPENTTLYRNIQKQIIELGMVKPFYASEGVNVRQVPAIDIQAMKEIEELERKARLEILRKGVQDSDEEEE